MEDLRIGALVPQESDQELNALHRSSEMEHVASRVRVKMAKTSGGGLILRREGTPSKST